MHGSTGDIILLGTTTDELEPTFKALTEADFDLGGSGSDVRTPSACVGPARCEWACYDTLDLCNDLTQTFQDELHRPAFPYKFKFKCSGCPNDCVASIARSDMSIIGTWRDEIRIDQDEVRAYAESGHEHRARHLRQLPHQVHGVGRQRAGDRRQQLREVHALHQRDAQGAATRHGHGRHHPAGLQGPDRPGRAALVGDRAVHQARAALRRDQRPRRAHLGLLERARQEPRARRRAHPARRAGQLPRGHRAWSRSPR